MLHSRVRLVLEYVKAVSAGSLPANHEVLRDAFSLCHRLPVLHTPSFQGQFYNQCNDVALMTYLGTLTKGCNTINQFVNKFNLLYDRQVRPLALILKVILQAGCQIIMTGN
ncbi:hypothetical protein V5799_025990 [Amblyomma americanum]|uniref:EIF3F/CSN6-like C-terminal domain-containing protein n=1 Tax=Amblyomma americanum TaxID=6943 RepID=A0AAQ4DJV4_AMBAM